MMILDGGLNNSPITVAIIISSIIILFATQTNALQVQKLYFSRRMIFEYHQYWRLFTSLIYFGPLKINVIVFMVTLAGIMSNVEGAVFVGRRLEFIIMLLFLFSFCWVSSLFTKDTFFGPIIVSFILYYWGKLHSDNRIVMNGIPVPAAWASLVSLGFGIMSGGKNAIMDEAIGIGIGHIYFYLHDVLSVRYGLQLLRPPRFLRKLVGEVKN